MWPFLLILAMIPLLFYWSDSVGTVFPALQKFLPEKNSPVAGVAGPSPTQSPEAYGLEPGQWYVSEGDTGYVAWTVSADGQYRLAVGCRPQAEASIQVTHTSGAELASDFNLNYGFGLLGLSESFYAGSDLVGAVAQFSDVYLQKPNREVLAHFQVPAADSGLVARALQQTCIAQ